MLCTTDNFLITRYKQSKANPVTIRNFECTFCKSVKVCQTVEKQISMNINKLSLSYRQVLSVLVKIRKELKVPCTPDTHCAPAGYSIQGALCPWFLCQVQSPMTSMIELRVALSQISGVQNRVEMLFVLQLPEGQASGPA